MVYKLAVNEGRNEIVLFSKGGNEFKICHWNVELKNFHSRFPWKKNTTDVPCNARCIRQNVTGVSLFIWTHEWVKCFDSQAAMYLHTNSNSNVLSWTKCPIICHHSLISVILTLTSVKIWNALRLENDHIDNKRKPCSQSLNHSFKSKNVDLNALPICWALHPVIGEKRVRGEWMR